MGEHPDAFLKHAHMPGCDGALVAEHYEPRRVLIDRLGRIGNGGIIAHVYICNRRYSGCGARVLVTEKAVRSIAVKVERRWPAPANGSSQDTA